MDINSIEPMQVWLDGELRGDTPYTVSIADDQKHFLEVKFNQNPYFVYEFERSSMPAALNLPTQHQAYWRAPYPNNEATADGKWALERESDFSVYLVNTSNSNERKLILTPDIGVGPQISPDGRLMIYIGKDHDAFWIAPIGEPEKRVKVFDQYVACMKEEITWVKSTLAIGFSPDSRWVWFTGSCAFAVASVDNPQEIALAYEGSTTFNWSKDSQRVAFSNVYENDALWVYHVVDGQLLLFSNELHGRPQGFSENGRYIWTWGLHETDGWFTYDPVRLIDLQTREVVIELKTQRPVSGMGPVLQSPDGKLYAFFYQLDGSEQGNIMVISADGKYSTSFPDWDYHTVVSSWLPESNYLLVRGKEQFLLTLIKVPDNFWQER